MASVRRSSRLSSIGGSANENNRNVINRVQESTPKKKSSTRLSTGSSSSARMQRNKVINKKRQVAITSSSESESESDSSPAKLEVSPPKQTRQSSQPIKESPSPSTLMTRLTFQEEKTEAAEKQAIAPSTPKRSPPAAAANKYQSARRVLNSTETQQLPGREEQLQQLTDFLREHLQQQSSGSLYVSGQPGTGKTACLSLLLRSPEFAHRIKRVYINCTSIASVGGVFKKICGELNLEPNGRTERHYQAAIQKHLTMSKLTVVIVLDEIDQLCSTRHSVLYTIFEWPSLPKVRLLLVGIANSLDLTDRVLNRLNAHCQLKPKLLHFPPYTKQQIIEIFKSRLQEAGVLDVFPPVTLQLLAAKVSAVSGDVRRALDIGRRVVELAEQHKQVSNEQINLDHLTMKGEQLAAPTKQESVPEVVQVKEVAAVLNTVYGASQNLQDDLEESFPLQQKLILCSLMLILRNERHKDISLTRLHEVYRRVCNKRNIQTLDQTEFNGLLDLVETRGILRVVRKKEPRLNRVQLQWDEEEVNGALKDKQLIASILDDTACLHRA